MKELLFALSLAVAAAAPVAAQEQAPPAGRSMFMNACGADIMKFCSSAQSRADRRACLQANKDKFSESCKLFMASHPVHAHGQGHMQGPGNAQ